MCSRRVSSFCYTCGTRRVTVVFTYSNLIYIIDRYRLVSHITLGVHIILKFVNWCFSPINYVVQGIQ
jgi:hypothetical protein